MNKLFVWGLGAFLALAAFAGDAVDAQRGIPVLAHLKGMGY